MPTAAPDTNLFPTLDSIETVLWPAAALLIFVITAVLVDVMILLAARWRLVDLPNRRSAHSLPTARGGGLAIVSTFSLGAIAVAIRWPVVAVPVLAGALLPCLAIAAVGFVDDIRPLRASLRLFIQIAIAALITVVLSPVGAIAIPGLPRLELGFFAWPFTIVWIVGMTNAFNFMDGSDGMAGMGAVVVGLCIGLLALRLQANVPMLLGVFLAAAAAGFLVFNWPPARIFMGDVGSGFLGTFFAALPLLFPATTRPLVFLPILFCLWPYIYDPFLSVLRRIANKKNPFEPHREFLFHRLIRSGASHSQAAMLYGLMAALGGLAGMLMLADGVPEAIRAAMPLAVIAAAAGLTWGIERRCARVELVPAESGHAPKPR
jgi:UDP-N-acetylmuramyl pentapeptide phosphotransferase/UDP-N-acetylglucosamine-1-phosphate transferase